MRVSTQHVPVCTVSLKMIISVLRLVIAVVTKIENEQMRTDGQHNNLAK